MLRDIQEWFGRGLPEEWFAGPAAVSSDADEILVMGELAAPSVAKDASPDARRSAQAGTIREFRELTRERRVAIATEAERRFGRSVAWGASCGDVREVFTSASVPVMTRLRMPERRVLDTLVESGVARSRSEAVAWCARLVGEHEQEWLTELREALVHVQKVRAAGPKARQETRT